MKTLVLCSLLLVIACWFSPPAAIAQPGVVFELSCPAGYSPLATFGKTFDALTGKWRANFCISTSHNGRMICQADGCQGIGGLNGSVQWNHGGVLDGFWLWDGTNLLTGDPGRLKLRPGNGQTG